MKQIKAFLVTVFLSLIFVSCASNSVENSEASKVTAPQETVVYDDWKYKGFGYELPSWVETALSGKSKSDEKIFIAHGINSDMSEQKLNEMIFAEDLSTYDLIGSTWVRLSETGEYISINIYKRRG